MSKKIKNKSYTKRPMKRPRLVVEQQAVIIANSETCVVDKISDLTMYTNVVTGRSFKIDCINYENCPKKLFDWMISLLEYNMADLYKSCDWGWDVDSKRSEMSEENVRFLIVYEDGVNKPVGFSHFRFDMDNNTSVVYCYELQLDTFARGQGLAKHIMKILERLCCCFNFKKVVLTVFNHNKTAINFFQSQGYQNDETSPENYSVKTCYSILSKMVRQS